MRLFPEERVIMPLVVVVVVSHKITPCFRKIERNREEEEVEEKEEVVVA